METLALLHVSVEYENPSPALEVRSDWLCPSVVGAMAISMAVLHQPAQALMRYGETGRGVSSLQAQLNLPADGIYGEQTYRRVRSFQATQGIPVDGVAGPITLSALGLNPNLSASGGNSGSYVPVSSSAVVTSRIGLTVRDRPNGIAIDGVDRGQRVALTGDRQFAGGHSWVQLSRGGWIAEEYIRYGGETPVSSGAYVSARVGLLVRDRPNGYEIGGLPNGRRVALTGARESAGGRSWVQLSRGGWVAEEYLAYR